MKRTYYSFLLLLLLSSFSPISVSETSQSEHYYPNKWGVGIGVRVADIPFNTTKETVTDVMPFLEFSNEYFFIEGLEGGVHLYKNDNHQINLYSRFRFADMPFEYQNKAQAQAFDFGFQYQYQGQDWKADVAFMSDSHKRSYGYSRYRTFWENEDWEIEPYAELNWKSSDFNSYYYGVDNFNIGGGVAASVGAIARYHVTSNLYLIGQAGISRLDDAVYDLPIIDSRYQAETFLGFGFFADKKQRQQKRPVSEQSGNFWRIAHGFATPSSLADILLFQAKTDPYNNQMTSAFYGIPLADRVFDAPIDIYFTPGAVFHYGSKVQNESVEGILAVKAFYTFELGPQWRFGAAEGLSYISQLTYVEGSEVERKGYQPSKLLNYLDFSLDVNLGDIFQSSKLKHAWFGYSIHHRSGIFETSSAFGRIKGGSNYQSFYLQWHF
ncbi:MipA/OmpV family protein [Paraferrimonas sp. SM1919]|uniref:MipA/OmpV family protein n=1 Tax=Paraferrimonas sp. SM1919 TaxID=2662263 RepID=UPI0013D2C885|nr:MipA/OmpV family protein [Paraferrimonas sp. SM1919]